MYIIWTCFLSVILLSVPYGTEEAGELLTDSIEIVIIEEEQVITKPIKPMAKDKLSKQTTVESITGIRLFSLKGCPDCDAAKRHMEKLGVDFEYIDCDLEENIGIAKKAMIEASTNAVPILQVNDKYYNAVNNIPLVDSLTKDYVQENKSKDN